MNLQAKVQQLLEAHAGRVVAARESVSHMDPPSDPQDAWVISVERTREGEVTIGVTSLLAVRSWVASANAHRTEGGLLSFERLRPGRVRLVVVVQEDNGEFETVLGQLPMGRQN